MQKIIGFTMVFAHGAVQKRNRPDFASSCFSFCFSVSFWVCFGSVLVRFSSVLGPFYLRFGFDMGRSGIYFRFVSLRLLGTNFN